MILEQPAPQSYRKQAGSSLFTNILILEGPRCSGKSTLGLALERQLQALGWTAKYFKKTVVHPTDERRNMFNHIAGFEDLLAGGDDIVIVDRFHASELVMALATGRTLPEEVIPYCREVDEWLFRTHLTRTMILLPPEHVVVSRMLQRPDYHSWDMPRERVYPLWQLAATLLPHAELITRLDQTNLVTHVVTSLVNPPGVLYRETTDTV